MASNRTRTSVEMASDVWRQGRMTALGAGTTMWDLLERLVRLANTRPDVLAEAMELPPLDTAPDA